jgi:hypothetical protein
LGVPIDAWLRDLLRDWAEQLLAPSRLFVRWISPVEPVRRAWQEHFEGTRNWQLSDVDPLMTDSNFINHMRG